jgi:predicted CoA-substrate-specific enzyme activase
VRVAYGVDLGSRRVKIAAEENGAFEYMGPFDTPGFYRTYIEPDAEGGILRRDLLGLKDEAGMAATGYGKARLGRGAVMVPELEAIIAGVKALTGLTDALILDVGGQDSKALLMRKGRMEDFAANDRCAASSGRFLENMSTALGIELEEMGRYWENPVELSSTCAIFGETELVGLMGEGHRLQDLAAGVNQAIVRRLLPLLSRFQADVLVLTGGVAYNQALRRLLRETSSVDLVVPDPPDFVAAAGCCRLAGGLE